MHYSVPKGLCSLFFKPPTYPCGGGPLARPPILKGQDSPGGETVSLEARTWTALTPGRLRHATCLPCASVSSPGTCAWCQNSPLGLSARRKENGSQFSKLWLTNVSQPGGRSTSGRVTRPSMASQPSESYDQSPSGTRADQVTAQKGLFYFFS